MKLDKLDNIYLIYLVFSKVFNNEFAWPRELLDYVLRVLEARLPIHSPRPFRSIEPSISIAEVDDDKEEGGGGDDNGDEEEGNEDSEEEQEASKREGKRSKNALCPIGRQVRPRLE